MARARGLSLIAQAAPADVGGDLAKIIEALPAKEPAIALDVCRKLLAGGPGALERLVTMVGQEFGDPKGVKAKYALHGVVLYAGRPKADEERAVVAGVLARQLGEGHSAELRAFLARQLQFCGRKEDVPALARLLGDDRLCEPATQALLAIGGVASATAMREALPGAKGKRRATIVKALGRLQDRVHAAEIRKALTQDDRSLRLCAMYALANMGSEEASGVLLKAAAAKPSYERTQATDACLRLARRIAERGSEREAEGILRKLLEKRQAEGDVHDRCAILKTLADVLGVAAVKDVLAAMDSKDLRFRVPAARTALALARAIGDKHKAEAAGLLKKITAATQEQAVLQEAMLLLGGANA